MRVSSCLGVAMAVCNMMGCAPEEGGTATAQLPTEAPEIVSAPRQGSGSFDGQIDEAPVVVADARLFVGPISTRDPSRRGLRIVLASHTGMCQRPDVMHPAEQALSLDVELGEGDALVAPGAYRVLAAEGGPAALARFDRMSATCSSKAFLAASGSVTIEEADKTHVRGTYELTLGRNEVRGAFDAVPCEGAIVPPLATHCER